MMATSELKKDVFNAWTDAGLDVRDLARGGLGDLALEDLDSAVPGGLSSPGAVAGARHVLAARMSFPHMDKARFLALAPVLLERQVPIGRSNPTRTTCPAPAICCRPPSVI
jgi:hypothetical protein